MAFVRGTCPSGYNWYTCATPAYEGCCSVDACSPLGCPSGSEYSVRSPTTSRTPPPLSTPQPTQVVQSSLGPTSGSSPTSGPSVHTSTSAPPTSKSASGQQSSTAPGPSSSIGSAPNSGKGPHDSNPTSLVVIVGVAIGGALIVLIIILIIILCRRRRRKSKNSAEGLPIHGGVPGPFPDDGPPKGFLAFFKRTPSTKITTERTSSPSTTYPELPSPSFPHNSLIPGIAELASPPTSPVSELSSADRGVYSSTNVSTASTGAVVSPHETLRGGGRPAMMPNMVPRGREGRKKHALSWQNFDPGDGY